MLGVEALYCSLFRPKVSVEVAVEVDRASQNANKVLSALLSGEVTLDEIKKYVRTTNKN